MSAPSISLPAATGAGCLTCLLYTQLSAAGSTIVFVCGWLCSHIKTTSSLYKQSAELDVKPGFFFWLTIPRDVCPCKKITRRWHYALRKTNSAAATPQPISFRKWNFPGALSHQHKLLCFFVLAMPACFEDSVSYIWNALLNSTLPLRF